MRVPAMHALLACCVVLPLYAQPGVYFDDSGAALRLGNQNFEVALSKSNGSILSILDKISNADLSLASNGGCLWAVNFNIFSTPTFAGGCQFDPAGTNRFTYSWNSGASTLTLQYAYDPAAARRTNAVVTMAVSSDVCLDMQLQVDNETGSPLQLVYFPNALNLDAGKLAAAYLPMGFPGVRIKPSSAKSLLPGHLSERRCFYRFHRFGDQWRPHCLVQREPLRPHRACELWVPGRLREFARRLSRQPRLSGRNGFRIHVQ